MQSAQYFVDQIGHPPPAEFPAGSFDFDKLKEVTMVTTKNLNKIIERNLYPLEEARN